MFKKRKEKKAQERNELRNQIETLFSYAIDEAEQIKDPAEKIIALQGVNEQIVNLYTADYTEIYKNGLKSYARTGFGGGLGAIAGGTALACVLMGTVGLAAFGIGAVAGLSSPLFAKWRSDAVIKKQEKEHADHFKNLEALQVRIDELTEKAVEENMREISRSPLCEKVRALPGLAEKFAATATKHFAAEETPAAEEAVAPAVEKKDEAPVLKQRAFDSSKLKGALNNKPKNNKP